MQPADGNPSGNPSGNPGEIERHTIFPIPLDQRHGNARGLFTLWFGSNIQMLAIVTGALASLVYKLSFTGAVLAIVLGNLIGAIFMALHAAQGPQLGVPQMVQSRGQFGSMGALFVVVLVILMYSGFVASNLVLGGQSVHAVAGSIDVTGGILIIWAISVAAAIYGHDLIHAYARLVSFVAGLALLFCFVWIVLVDGLPADFWARGHLTAAGFFGTLSVGALWQIAYAPYVSDYTRYLPPDTGSGDAFWASYWGCAIGSILPMILGALIGLLIADGDVAAGLARAMGGWGIPIIVILSLALASSNAINIYCCALSAITVGQTLLPNWRSGPTSRTVISLAIGLAAVTVAIWGQKDFLTYYTNFIALLLYVMVPWTAVNLVDYYLIQHGDYDVASFFRADGGVYGRYNGLALGCYAFGIVVQAPFMVTDLYTGPAARALGDVDVSWLVGLALVSPLYYLLARRPALRLSTG